MNSDLSSLPTPALVALGVAALVQVALAVTALILLARTPRERLLFERKWPWILIIVFVNLIGAVLFLAIGRRPATAANAPVAAPEQDTVSRVVDSLYGDDQP